MCSTYCYCVQTNLFTKKNSPNSCLCLRGLFHQRVEVTYVHFTMFKICKVSIAQYILRSRKNIFLLFQLKFEHLEGDIKSFKN